MANSANHGSNSATGLCKTWIKALASVFISEKKEPKVALTEGLNPAHHTAMHATYPLSHRDLMLALPWNEGL